MRRVRVLMGESLVGTIDFEARTNKQISTFRYDAAWMESGFAIAPSMPLATGTFYSSAPGLWRLDGARSARRRG